MTDAVRHEPTAVSLTPYWLLGIFALLLALVLRAPASLLQKALPNEPSIAVSAWGGTVWSGQAALDVAGQPGFLSWQWQPEKLLKGRFGMALSSRGEGGLAVEAEWGLSGWALDNLHGEIPSGLLQALLPPGWSLPGTVQARGLQLARNGLKQGPWQRAGGQLEWPGGVMQYRLQTESQSATLPPLRVELRLEGQTLVLALSEAAGNLGLALLRLEPDGTVETRVRERLLRYSPGYRSSGGDADAIVVTARQTL